MIRAKYFYFIATYLLFSSCYQESVQVYHQDFKEYVDEFFFQANQRGLNLNPEDYNFSIKFGNTGDDVGGYCSFFGNAITLNSEDWELWDHFKREIILFHELGHCILNRKHRNAESTSDECFSYMNENLDCSFNPLSAYWREYYLDELFGEDVSLPEWYLINQDYATTKIPFRDSMVIKDTIIEFDRLESDILNFSQQDTFLFEIEFNNAATQEPLVMFLIGNLSFSHCDACTSIETTLKIGNNIIYSTGDFKLNTDIKFSIFKNKDVVSFYINDYFVHAMEYSLIEGNMFKTKTFDEKMGISVRYLYNP